MIIPLLCVLGVFVFQTLLPASFRYLLAGPGVGSRLLVALGNRDSQPPLSNLGMRADRALANLYEALPVFITLALLLVIRGPADELAMQGAWTFFVARALYVPAYLSGVYLLRSVIWAAGWVGLGMMLASVLRGV